MGSWTGRDILLYLIMYRKYVRKWLLLKRNRIIWPEVAVNPPKTVLYLIVVGGEQPIRGMPGRAMPSGVKVIG